MTLRIERKVDHHDRVFLHNPDEQDQADGGNQGQVLTEKHQRRQRAGGC